MRRGVSLVFGKESPKSQITWEALPVSQYTDSPLVNQDTAGITKRFPNKPLSNPSLVVRENLRAQYPRLH